MLLADVNVLVNAHRQDGDRHDDYRQWLSGVVNDDEPYAVSDFVVNGFLRIVTNRRIYKEPSGLADALGFATQVRNQPHAVVIAPGMRFWDIFIRLSQQVDAKAKLVPDAYLAALAIEHGCEFVSADRDFARFPGLRWRHPLN